ncbi:MAG: dCTP deaminase [Candidatus Binatia bacterium]
MGGKTSTRSVKAIQKAAPKLKDKPESQKPGVLGYSDLHRAWKSGELRFEPDIEARQIGLSSIDLRLGSSCTRLKDLPGIVVQPARKFDPENLVDRFELKADGIGGSPSLRLKSGEFRLAFTLEKLFVPLHLTANVQGKSGPARAGLAVHITAPTIHPNFRSNLTLELYNHGPWELELFPGDLICQVLFYHLCTPVPADVAGAIGGTFATQTKPFPAKS